MLKVIWLCFRGRSVHVVLLLLVCRLQLVLGLFAFTFVSPYHDR